MDQVKSVVQPVFSNPVAQQPIGRELHSWENKSFKKILRNMSSNVGNLKSDDDYVLERKGLEDIKTFFEASINKFVTDIYKPKNNVEFYITQSWLNVNKNNMFHHRHYHPNSYLSGVFYLSCTDNDKIQFYNTPQTSILSDLFESSEENANIFNSGMYSFNIKKLDLMIFPSYLEHGVPTNTTNQIRTSLSFNTFVRGDIGSRSTMSQVILQ